jgi:hypothetical protein
VTAAGEELLGYLSHPWSQRADGQLRVRFEIGDAQALPVASDTFDAVVSGLVLNFVPERPRMLAEMARATRAGGTVALYLWDYAGAMEIMRRFWDAAKAIDPAAAALDEGARFPMCAPAPLAALFGDAGLAEERLRACWWPRPKRTGRVRASKVAVASRATRAASHQVRGAALLIVKFSRYAVHCTQCRRGLAAEAHALSGIRKILCRWLLPLAYRRGRATAKDGSTLTIELGALDGARGSDPSRDEHPTAEQ